MNFRNSLINLGDKSAASFALMAKLAMCLIVIGITLDATGRYLFSSPILGMQAIVEGMLQPIVVFFAIALAARHDGHMRVDIIRLEKWPLLMRLREAIFSLLIVVFWLLCGWQAGLRAYDAYVEGQWPVGQIETPAVIAYSIVALGCFMAALCHLIPRRPSQDGGE
ncbi:MAG: hypothetical protein CMN55_01840 [Sneathiella sp.]|uniref:TRAP transporter small permease n=1 Tax=Sneathiella sp. TaxID=1964365 RepID=UPI000C625AEB|nr:TRAP transporter small permease [Sneathiella sp.]MAL77844.1 hypothetical protein [Sneathiella sp.]